MILLYGCLYYNHEENKMFLDINGKVFNTDRIEMYSPKDDPAYTMLAIYKQNSDIWRINFDTVANRDQALIDLRDIINAGTPTSFYPTGCLGYV